MKTFLAALFGSGSKLSDLEKIVLNCVRDHLGGTTAARWDEQVNAINKVQRLPDGVEVNFYRMKKGHPSFEAQLAFANRTEELLVAKAQIGLPNVTERLRANVWCVKGFLFSIEYEGSVKYFDEAAAMDPAPRFKISCELMADLAQTAPRPV
jgi:hypothetical protein